VPGASPTRRRRHCGERLRRRIWLAALALLWLVTPCGAAELVVESPPALESKAGQVRQLDQAALARSLERAGLRLPERIQVFLVEESAPIALQTPHWFVGRAFGTRTIVVFPARISSYPFDSLLTVVRHEVVHLALTAEAGERPLPRWFHEGVATSVEAGWSTTGQLRLLLAAFDRPRVDAVDRLFEADARPANEQAYLLAAALVEDLRDRHGANVVGRIADEVAGGRSFDSAFELQTGEPVDQAAARAWAGYRRVALWIPIVTSPAAVWFGILALAVVAFFFQKRRRREQRRRWELEEESAAWADGPDGSDLPERDVD
jgi:hypothetical protein